MMENTMVYTATGTELLEKLADAAREMSVEQLEKLLLVVEGMRIGQRDGM